MPKQQINFEKFSPLRRPEWRLERTLQLADRQPSPGRCTPRDDKYVVGARNFILRYRNADDADKNLLGYENPGLFWAWQLYDNRHQAGQHQAIMIEARILAGQTDEEIARGICTIPEVVEWYEAMFFNIRDRHGAHDWIIEQVLMPAFYHTRAVQMTSMTPPVPTPTPLQGSTPPGHTPAPPAPVDAVVRPINEAYFDCTVKWFAYFGGPILLDYVISGFNRGAIVRSREEMGDWFDNHYMTRLRHRSAASVLTFDINKYNVMTLFELHNQIIQIARSAESQQQAQDVAVKGIAAMLEHMPFAAGREGRKLVKNTVLEPYDASAAELTAEEMMRLSVGQKASTIEGVALLKLPTPEIPGQE